MLKKIFQIGVLAGMASTAWGAGPDLAKFGPDLDVFMNSIAQDVAPTLRLGALAGDLQADATIDHFDGAFGLGLNLSDGVGKVLRPGATAWQFAAPMDEIVPSNFTQTFMAYPSIKFAFGFALVDGWDAILSGNYLPSSLSSSLAKPFVSGGKSVPELGYTNIGVVARRTLIRDTGSMTSSPALSLGVGYHYTSFHMGMDVDGWLSDVDASGQTVSTTGSIDFDSGSQIVTFDLHVSKHFAFATPYAKLVGAYQNTTFTGKAALTTTANPSGDTESFVSKPSVNLSDFAFLTTVGIDLDLFIFHYNLNVMADLSRALLNVHSFSLEGIDANAFAISTGFHWAF